MATRIVIGGPRSCGKSTLSSSLFSILKSSGVRVGIHEIDVYSDTIWCILGRKPWEKRRKKKHAWFYPTIQNRINEFSGDNSDLVLGDLPGKITNPFLPKMVEPAHCAIVVSGNFEGLEEWEKFFLQQGIVVVARVITYLDQLPLLPLVKKGQKEPIMIGGLRRQVLVSKEIKVLSNQIRLLQTEKTKKVAVAT